MRYDRVGDAAILACDEHHHTQQGLSPTNELVRENRHQEGKSDICAINKEVQFFILRNYSTYVTLQFQKPDHQQVVSAMKIEAVVIAVVVLIVAVVVEVAVAEVAVAKVAVAVTTVVQRIQLKKVRVESNLNFNIVHY